MAAATPSCTKDATSSSSRPDEDNTRERHPHQDAAPVAFVDTFVSDLVSASRHVGVDEIEIASGKLRLAITLLDAEIARRGQR